MAKENGSVKEKKTLTLDDILAKHNLKQVIEYEKYERLPSGSLMLDRALGGGWPRGTISEVWGNPSFGKSLLSYISIGRTLADGGTVVLFDMERRFQEEWAGFFMDVDNPNFKLIQQEARQTAESILNSIFDLAMSGTVDQMVLDSKDALVFAAEIEGEIGPRNMGIRSFYLGNFMRQLKQIIGDSKTCFMFVSEVRAAFGNTYNPLTTSGGYQIEHKCDIQNQMFTPEKLKQTVGGKEVEIGMVLKSKTNKNATFKKEQKAEIQVRQYNTTDGVIWRMDTAHEVIQLGTELNMFTNKSGEVYKGAGSIIYNGQDLGSRNEALISLMAEPALLSQIEMEIRKQLGWL